jgi:hypothetical protein
VKAAGARRTSVGTVPATRDATRTTVSAFGVDVGFGPPILGLVLSAAATRINVPSTLLARLPDGPGVFWRKCGHGSSPPGSSRG